MNERNNSHLRRDALALLFPMMLLGCTDEMRDLHPDEGADALKLEFQATINQEASSRADDTGFADGDRFGVFVINYSNGRPGTLTLSGNQASNVAIGYNADSNTWIPTSDIYWKDNVTPVDVFGYYPFDNAIASVTEYPFQVSKDQSGVASNGEMGAYEASDFLWAKASNAQPDSPVKLIYSHKMAGVKVILTEGTGFASGEFSALSKTVTVDNTLRGAYIDLSTGVVTKTGAFDYNIVMNPEDDCYRAVVVPQSVGAGKTTIGISLDGADYSYTRDGGMTYTAGKLHKFTLKIDKTDSKGAYKISLVSEGISDWETDRSSHDFEANSYVVVNCEEAGKLKETLAAGGVDYLTVKNLKVTGVLNTTDCFFMRDEMESLTSLNLKETRFPYVDMGWSWDTESTIYAENALPSNAFYGNKTIRRFVLPESIVEIGAQAFREVEITSAIVIPESVKKIGACAFSYIWENGEIILPSKLEIIEHNAFRTGAKFELRLPSTLKYIGNEAFAEASNAYGAFSIPANLEYLGPDAFLGTGHDMTGDVVIPAGLLESLSMEIGFANGTNITLPEGLKRIDRLAGKFNSPLVLPSSLERIENGAFYCTRFTGPVVLPDNIVYIGPSAFQGSNLTGRVEIPPLVETIKGGSFSGTRIAELIIGDQVQHIEREAFSYNGELRYVEIGKNVQFIGERAFEACGQIQTLVSFAKEPARASDAFQGCDFERTVLEVPEGCVDIYRHSEGWKNFHNITEHRELAVDVSDIECLEHGMTREAILRAEGDWKVTRCPSWVHVDPMESTAKDNLTITVDPQDHSAEGREGIIEFTLTGKNYTTCVNVRQMKAEYPEDTEIILQEASASGKEIPLVILGEGFTAPQILDGRYMQVMNETMEQFFDIEPYKSLRDHFTVITSIACSPDEGVCDLYTSKQNKFDTYGLEPSVSIVREYTGKLTSARLNGRMGDAVVIVVANLDVFGGWSTICDDGFTVACVGSVRDAVYPYDQRGLVQHYAGGMAFAGLGEETVSHFEHIKACKCGGCNALHHFTNMKARGYFANLTLSGKMSEAPWYDFIFDPRYSSEVDMWEGGNNHLRGVWRSESQSVMGTYIRYFNAISRYEIYKGVMRRAGLPCSLDDFITNDIIEKP